MKTNIEKASVKFREDLLYFQHFMQIFVFAPLVIIKVLPVSMGYEHSGSKVFGTQRFNLHSPYFHPHTVALTSYNLTIMTQSLISGLFSCLSKMIFIPLTCQFHLKDQSNIAVFPITLNCNLSAYLTGCNKSLSINFVGY